MMVNSSSEPNVNYSSKNETISNAVPEPISKESHIPHPSMTAAAAAAEHLQKKKSDILIYATK